MASVPETQAFNDVCTNLSLGACSLCTKEKTCCSSMFSNKRKRKPCKVDDDDDVRKRQRGGEQRRWGYSTDLMLHDDPWKIKKKLTRSDLGYLSRLLLKKDLVEDLVLPVLSPDAQTEALNGKGTKILIWDMDTQSLHFLIFKLWASSGSYVFIDNWNKDFVRRRGLSKGDEINLHWDPYKNCFDFSVRYS